jgi:hypothetical protein
VRTRGNIEKMIVGGGDRWVRMRWMDAIHLITSSGFILFSFVKYLQVGFTSTIRWTAIYVLLSTIQSTSTTGSMF